MVKRIFIRKLERPKKKNSLDNVRWFCDSLGLSSGRDLDCVSFKVFYEILNLSSGGNLVSTGEVADSLDLECPTINHHIRNLMNSGFLSREKRKIALREGSLYNIIKEMKKESDSVFEELFRVSKKLDDDFGFV